MGYFKENCCWATSEQQQNNKVNNIRVEIDGVIRTVSQWARHFGIISIPLALKRIRDGEDPLSALTSAPRYWDGRTHTEETRELMSESATELWALRRAEGRMTGNATKTHCPKGHSLSGDNLRLYNGHRYCRTCENAKQKRIRAARKAKRLAEKEQP